MSSKKRSGRTDPHRDKERPTAFARWLTQHRLARGLRQSDLAFRLGIHSGRIAELECGRRLPSESLAWRLHAALGPDVPPPPWPPDQP
jgi:ribosome-binding protein aMBF1 (putative translation factor)